MQDRLKSFSASTVNTLKTLTSSAVDTLTTPSAISAGTASLAAFTQYKRVKALDEFFASYNNGNQNADHSSHALWGTSNSLILLFCYGEFFYSLFSNPRVVERMQNPERVCDWRNYAFLMTHSILLIASVHTVLGSRAMPEATVAAILAAGTILVAKAGTHLVWSTGTMLENKAQEQKAANTQKNGF